MKHVSTGPARALGVRLGRIGICLAAGMALFPAAASAQAAKDGRLEFVSACAACHGADARGDGPTAALLTLEVPDLTKIAERNGGTFDLVRVILTVDGRAGLAAHGGPMPMYGGLLTGPSVAVDAADGTPVTTTAPILAIAQWLETQQSEDE